MMKVAFLLLVLAVVAVQHSDTAWVRGVVRRVGNVIRRVIRTVPRLVKVWNSAKQIWEFVKVIKSGKRGLAELDLNQDGQVDVEELSKMIGERDARDLMNELADSSDSIAIEEFERNLRDFSELAEENNLQFED